MKSMRGFVLLAVVAGILSGCAGMGVKSPVMESQPAAEDELLLGPASEDIVSQMQEAIAAQKLVVTLVGIKKFFYKEVDVVKCAEQILDGGVRGCTDIYSRYMDKEKTTAMKVEMSGVYIGVGTQLVKKDKETVVESVIKDSPAEHAGIRGGDVILAISPKGEKGKSVAVSGKPLSEVVALMNGEENVPLIVSVLRNGKEIDFPVKRGRVRSTSVFPKKAEDGVGYVRITEFGVNAKDDFEKAVDDFVKSGTKAIVVDLRNNPGGLVDSVIGMISFFQANGDPVLYVRSRNNPDMAFLEDLGLAKKRGKFKKLKVVFLVNKYSASASEIMSGWFREYFNSPVVGETTFGKGCMQSILPMPDGNFLRLTTHLYLIGKGKVSIHGVGVVPTHRVENKPGDGKDYQLLKAKEIAKGLIAR